MARSQKSAGMWSALTLILVLLLVSVLLAQRSSPIRPARPKSARPVAKPAPQNEGGLIRHPTRVNYSRHARCRMKCRHIEEAEVLEILARGTINTRKSELHNAACNNRYAVEGRTHDGQMVRIVFAPCNTEETVVTVIDLGREWQCACN